MILPDEALPLPQALAPASTRPIFARFVTLLGAAILTTGRRTVANLLRAAAPLACGHPTSYRRTLSSASWSAMRLSCSFCRVVLMLVPADRPIPLVAATPSRVIRAARPWQGEASRPGPLQSRLHRLAVRHKWVVLAVLVRFPWATRPWALPVLVDLYRSEEDDRLRGRPHRTPAQIMATLLRLMLLWLPGRRFVFVGDAGYGTHELARFAYRHRPRLTLVHPEAILFDPPPRYRGNG